MLVWRKPLSDKNNMFIHGTFSCCWANLVLIQHDFFPLFWFSLELGVAKPCTSGLCTSLFTQIKGPWNRFLLLLLFCFMLFNNLHSYSLKSLWRKLKMNQERFTASFLCLVSGMCDEAVNKIKISHFLIWYCCILLEAVMWDMINVSSLNIIVMRR